MPTINIPPRVRFVLYIAGALALLTVSYASEKSWAGDPEVRYVTGIVSLLQLLAAAKTDLSGKPEGPPPDTRPLRRSEAGASRTDFAVLATLVVLVLLLLYAFGNVRW